MWKFIVDNFGAVTLSVLFFVAGIMLGFSVKSKNDGLFIVINNPDPAIEKPLLEIGKHNRNHLSLDISKLTSIEAKQISAELSQLPPLDNPLSGELREMVRQTDGPFGVVEKLITFRLVDDSDVNRYKGKACSKSVIFNHAVLAKPPESNSNELKSFTAFVGKHGCSDEELDNFWVSKSFVESWLGISIPQNTIQLTSHLTVTSL